MIQFSCPSCAAVYSVGDEKAGKTGKCPKCDAKFVIPDAERGAAPSPPPPPVDDGNVEIKPCPGCQAKLTVAKGDLGLDVECPYCKTVYKASKTGGSSAVIRTDRPSKRSAPLEDDDDDRPRRRRRDEDDDDDDRPRKRSRRDDDEEDDEDDRPRRRSRRDDDDDDYDRPRRRRSRRVDTSATKAPGIFLLIVGILGLLVGVFYVLQAIGIVGVGRNNALPNNAMAGPALLLFAITGPIWGLAVTLGGYNMINLKSRGSCIVACIFAFLPCNGCCILGIPAAIWALVVLNRDEVKRAFDS